MTRNGSTALGIGAALLVLAADQGSKWWVLDVLHLPDLGSISVLPVLNLTMVWNRGVTFGLLNSAGRWGTPLLVLGALAIVLLLGIWLRRSQRPAVVVSLGAIAGGAIGNIIDRLRFGAVVDFIHAHAFGHSWYVFNVADAAIVCGVGVLLVDGMRRHDGRLASAGDQV